MTNRLLLLLSALAIVAVITPLSVTVGAAEMNCRVPFNFVVNGKTLPAGTYTFSSHNGVLIVRGLRDGAAVMTRPLDSSAHVTPRAVFEKTGDRYVLREAWMGGMIGGSLPGLRWDGERSRTAAAAPVERIVILGN